MLENLIKHARRIQNIVLDIFYLQNQTIKKMPLSKNEMHKKSWIRENSILLLTLLGVITGIVLGFSFRSLNLSETTIMLISYPGELYMRLLKLIILPLIVSSIIIGSSSLNAKLNGKIILRTLAYFFVTSAFNALLGILLGIGIKPGVQEFRIKDTISGDEREGSMLDSFLDLGRNIITENIFQAAFQQEYTSYTNSTVIMFNNSTEAIESQYKIVRFTNYRNGTNTLGIVFFCTIFGTTLGTLGEKSTIIIKFFDIIYEAIMKLVQSIILLTPFGVASIIAGKILSVIDIIQFLSQLGWLILTVLLGVFIYQLVIMPLVYFIVVKKNPFKFYLGLSEGTLTAFATASTAAALPITFTLTDNKLKLDPRITRFVLPIGCNINMDGTALYIAVASVFVAQIQNVTLDIGNLFTIWAISTAASFSSVSVPSAGVILVSMVLSAIGAPLVDIPLLFSIDWLVDRFRTTNNMLGDCYAAAIVEKLSQKELKACTIPESLNLLTSSEFTKDILISSQLSDVVIT